MASLSKEQWDAARTVWEEDTRAGYGWLAESLGVSRQAVSKMATKQGWTKKVAQPGKVVAQPAKAQPKQPAKKAPSQPEASATAPGPRMSSADWELMTRRPRGRPTDYRDEFVDEIIKYFDIQVESVVDVDVPDREGKMTTQKQVVVNTFPTLTRFASTLGVTRDTLYEWATGKTADGSLKHPEFSYAYARAKDLQDALLTEGGMAGRYEARFATFAAKNIIGWKDQIETTTEVTVKTASTEELDNAYQRGIEESARQRALVMARKTATTDGAGN